MCVLCVRVVGMLCVVCAYKVLCLCGVCVACAVCVCMYMWCMCAMACGWRHQPAAPHWPIHAVAGGPGEGVLHGSEAVKGHCSLSHCVSSFL